MGCDDPMIVPWPQETEARSAQEESRTTCRPPLTSQPTPSCSPGTPPTPSIVTLETAYDVIVVACRGRGLSKLLLGSCASRLACKTTVPVLLIPGPAAISAEQATATTAGSQ